MVRSSHGHARIRAIDVRDARTLPGVVAAWSAADLPEAARPILAGSEGAHKGRPFAARVLAGDVVRYVGECVAVVVADDPYRLADAIERVAVDYEPLPALITAEEALASETRLHADWPDNAAVVARGSIGDAEQALSSRRRGRERALPPRAPRRGVHRDARRAGLSRSGLGPARPLVVHAEPVLDPGRRRAHRRRARRRGPRARA